MTTIYGTLLDTEGNPLYADITVTSLSTPVLMAGGGVVASFSVKTKSNSVTGYWSVTLEAGNYQIEFDYNNSLSPCFVNVAVPIGTSSISVDELETEIATFNYAAGTYALTSGVQSGTLTGLAIPFTPTSVTMTVVSPSGGLVLYAAVNGAITSDGWSFLMNGMTDASGYVINWLATP